jgi:hypothetical protein
LLNNALGDGARATKFDADIYFTNSELFPDREQMRTLVKATTFPGKSHTVLDLKYKGRSIPVKGQVKYNQTWNCTFYLTEDHKLKNAFEVWLEALDQKHNYTPNTKETPGLDKTQKANKTFYTSNVHLFQRNFDNTQITAQYYLYNVFPIEVSAVEYSSESIGTVQEFNVMFAYSYYEMQTVKGEQGNFIDQFVDRAITTAAGYIDQGLSAFGDIASDAVGSMTEKLDALSGGLNDLFEKGLQTARQANEQIARGVSSMKKSIDDVVDRY